MVARSGGHVVEEGLVGSWPPAIIVLAKPHPRGVVVYELVLFHEGIVVDLHFDSMGRHLGLLFFALLKLSNFAAI